MTRINNFINRIFTRLPVWFHISVVIAVAMTTGIVRTHMNNVEAQIANGVTWDFITSLIWIYALYIILEFVDKYGGKIIRLKLTNKFYYNMTENLNRSKISDINKINTGKIHDAFISISDLKCSAICQFIWLVPCIMPAANIIVRESKVNITCGIITMISLTICTTMALLANKIFGWTNAAKKKKARLMGISIDNILNVKTLKNLHKTNYAEKRLSDAQIEAQPVMTNCAAITWYRFIDVIAWAPILINMWILRNDIELCTLVLMANYTIDNLRSTLVNIAETLSDLDAQKKVIADIKGDDDVKRPIIKSTISLKNVSFDYGPDTTKFFVRDLEFAKGTRTLITGGSGEGKSSLANLLTGSIKAKTGEVPTFDYCYIWQETECLDDTLWNNIVFDNEYGVTKEEVEELFDELNMFEWFTTLPEGFNTHIGEKGCKLSSGQKQRVNLIRLIIEMRYAPNKVFIVDEITSNLDANTRELAIALIDRECRSTLICISHNEGFDKICDNHIEVKNHCFIPVVETRQLTEDIKIWKKTPIDHKVHDAVMKEFCNN